MKRMKTFFKYFLILLIFYFVSNGITYLLLKSNYIARDYEVDIDEPQVTISEMKSTVLNGYTKGKIKNTTNDVITGKALKLDYYSKNGVLVGTKYCDVNNLLVGESKSFESRFNFDNVDSVKVSLVDVLESMNGEEWDFTLDDWSKDKVNWFILLGALIVVFG